MNEFALTQFISETFPGVEAAENFGYTFFFCGADHKLPFATLASSDNEHDSVSNLDRPGVFRLNIGVSKQTFQSLLGNGEIDVSQYDFTALDTILPHPHYAAQNFVSILNPSEASVPLVKRMLAEAWEIAVRGQSRRDSHAPSV